MTAIREAVSPRREVCEGVAMITQEHQDSDSELDQETRRIGELLSDTVNNTLVLDHGAGGVRSPLAASGGIS